MRDDDHSISPLLEAAKNKGSRLEQNIAKLIQRGDGGQIRSLTLSRELIANHSNQRRPN